MSATYKAIEVTKPGEFSLLNKPLRNPGPNQVRIRIEACGVCHSDAATVDGLFPIEWPRVPSHEVVGKIDVVASGVQGWTVGQRFSAASGVSAMIETLPLEKAPEAYAKMMAGRARFRMVLTMDS